MEERIRRFIKAAGPPPEPTEREWQAFVAAAHRHVATRRALTLVAAAALIAGAAVLGGRLATTLRDTNALPPAQHGALRIGRGDELPRRCPAAQAPEMAGDLGLVALVRDGDLFVVDVTSRAERLLIDGVDGYEPRDPSFSFDGRYVTTGDGVVVPAAGGQACAPLGADVRGARWSRAGLVALRTDGSGLVVARPNGEVRDVRLRSDTLEIGGFVLDPRGEQAALDVHGGAQGRYEGVWLAQIMGEGEGPPNEIYALPRAMLAGWRLEVAAHLPELDSVLAFRVPRSASLAADGGQLLHVPIGRGAPGAGEVAEMLPYRDFISSCGDRIVVAAGAGRYVTANKHLLVLAGPDFGARALGAADAYTWPSCTPGGQVLATVTEEGYETRAGRLPRALALVSLADGSEERVAAPEGKGYEYPLPAGVSDHILVVERVLEPRGPAALVLLDGAGEPLYRVAELGEVDGYYGHYGYSELFDWYNAYPPFRDRR